MLLAPASFDMQLIKEDKTQYCKDLIALIPNSHALKEQSFHSALSGEENLKHHTFQPGDFIYWKRHLESPLSDPNRKRHTLHLWQEVTLLYYHRKEEERFFFFLYLATAQPMKNHYTSNSQIPSVDFLFIIAILTSPSLL